MKATPGAEAIRISKLTKTFGPVKALAGLELTVRKGEVFGFLGPNGAGKSTAIRILMGLIAPTSGQATMLGHAVSDKDPELRSRVGYLPGELRTPGKATAGRYLNYLAALRNGSGDDQISALAERFDLDLARPIKNLSKGNKQKVGLIQAFMHGPELLILDEPTSGLDPLLQHEFQQLIHERQHHGATVFMSSHVLSEVEDVAERVAIIKSGSLVDVDDLDSLRRRAGQRVEMRFLAPVDPHDFGSIEGLTEVTIEPEGRGGSKLSALLQGEPDQLIKAAARHHVVGFRSADRELEHLFLDFYRGDKGRQPNANQEQAARGV